MIGVLELNREEITRLSRMDDIEGHAWALYVLLKKNMESYTGTVQVEPSVLVNVLSDKLVIEPKNKDLSKYVDGLIAQLRRVEIISDCFLNNNLLSIKLPIALSDTCLEDGLQH